MESGIMYNNIRISIFVYTDPLISGGTLEKDLGTLKDTYWIDKWLPVKYYLPVYVYEHVEGKLELFYNYQTRLSKESYKHIYPLRTI